MHFSTGLAAISALVASCAAHSLLSTPPPRGNTKWWGTCSAGAGCKGPCDSPMADSPFNSIYVPKKYVQRGQELEVAWNRLNHPGGFVRLAMVPFNQSDSWTAFNDNVLKYSCYETNCKTSAPNDMTFGYLNGPGSSPCTTKVTVPSNIPDNTAVTLQWIWFGGGIYYGEPDTSFGEYYGCSDMIVSGGSAYSDVHPVATFQGGDVTYPNSDVCKYWGSNKVGDCNFGSNMPNPIEGNLLSQSLEPCMHSPETKGKPYGFGSSDNSQTLTSLSPSAVYSAPASNIAPASDTGSSASSYSVADSSVPEDSSSVQSVYLTQTPDQPAIEPSSSGQSKCIPLPSSAF
ncbi:hypothetical protein GGI25_002803 [Coemansia spiralis]|uniref:Uncharacterized protein n=2 Tax=Coemansia TaxID=4863 RepID=A0A9W8G7V5_9FUNG|nr:hypothetical protein EDC05_004715 [Coemansia umbellata]KAJ2622350.1 hypothetical protein GGI26_003361 [Coemansia sp. RSA 1358]KAJ2677851.1 hypothetical protein GGI25_002803 [Coemansia spiralis]